MPSTRVAYPEIQSWTPAVEAKAVETGSLFVLDGKNFVFDSKGPKSGFGGAVLPAGKVQTSFSPVESVSLANRTLLMTETQALERVFNDLNANQDNPLAESWSTIAELSSIYAPNYKANRWTKAYVGYTSYVCHPQHGIYRVASDSLDTYDAEGAPEEPIGITESNGRLIILSKFTVSWSAPFDGENLNPALGGGGFQITAELIPGNPVAVTPFEAGFLVWTDGGVLIAEFTGGDEVFRYDAINSEQLMLSGVSWTAMDDASVVVVTKKGLHRSTATAGFQDVDPIFNEFLRDRITASDDLIVRLFYIQEADELYVQFMDGVGHFNETYVLTMKVGKWGIFSQPHLGICRFSHELGDYGYIDLDGNPIRFNDSAFIEYLDGTRVGLDSEITVGYMRPAGEARSADVEFEMQEVLVTATRKSTITDYIEEDWGGSESFVSYDIGFYLQDEDWNAYGLSDFQEDWGLSDSADGVDDDEDWDLPGADWDLGASVIGEVFFDWNDWDHPEDWGATPEGSIEILPREDWQLLTGEEDWDGPQAFLNPYSYQISVIADLDGFDSELIVQPALAVAKPDSDFYTLYSHGHNHRVKFEANQVGEKFHVRQLAITLHYSGQLS